MTDNCYFISSINEISKKEWESCSGQINPFTSYDFFYALEKSGSSSEETGWKPSHYIQKNSKNEIEVICPLFIKSHSYGEYIFDHVWADAYHKYGLKYYPKLQSAIPFTPVTGKRFLVKRNNIPKNYYNKIIENIITLSSKLEISSIHFNFLTKEEINNTSINNIMLRKGIQFHWENQNFKDFNDFLAKLTSRKRKLINKERKCLIDNNLEVEILTGNTIRNNHWDFFYKCYLNTTSKKWGAKYLNREFFRIIGELMPHKIVLILAKNEKNYIAGALNFIDNESLYGRLWGSTEHIPYLHFEICYYQAIDFAIKNNLKKIEAGAQGNHKIQRGYLPKETYSLHWIKNINFKDAINSFLNEEIRIIENQKKHLRKFTPFK
ncbi:MAG: hypothetical protein CFH19_01114 [Alphaproteobacteria bacterium MarineAlpha5_Bin9]|nr:MAG: hypothetical protein CFH19_01114 [Alphaproteobacteria bacterium MarineAlpha5_Bin9]|tara:strand:- start:28976 stop:30112 length:1137 start_codon:yes stop_codon:yes gene_type:complete